MLKLALNIKIFIKFWIFVLYSIFSWKKKLLPNFAFWGIFKLFRCLHSLEIKLQSSIRVICTSFKGQLISKANCQAVNSSKERKNEFVSTSMPRVFVHSLEEIEDYKKAFRNYLTFSCGLFSSWKLKRKQWFKISQDFQYLNMTWSALNSCNLQVHS